MKIKLICPRSTVRPMDSAWKIQMAPPLGLLVLAALTPQEHEVYMEDENVERLNLLDRPDLVGITVKIDTVYRARAISEVYRRQGIPVVWGGIYPTMCPDQCQEDADAIVVGEAEMLWKQVLQDASRGCLQALYRNTISVPAELIPIPRWDILNSKRYLFSNTLRIGRGCPWRCDFCYNSSPNMASGYKAKPVNHVLQEIESLGLRHVMFIDDNFIGDPDKARALMAAMKPLNLTWHAAVSADIGKYDDILDGMPESGCKSLFIGFETLNRKNLTTSHKGQNQVERYTETVAKIHSRGMMVNASLVFGFDHDSPSVFPETLDWLVQNRIETMTAHLLTPYPGTKLYERLQGEGRILDHDLLHYNTAHVVFQPCGMSARELQTGYRWMYKQFYSWANMARRIPCNRRQLAAYLAFNLIYRKFGKVTCLAGKVLGMRNLARLAACLAYKPHASRRGPKATAENCLPGITTACRVNNMGVTL